MGLHAGDDTIVNTYTTAFQSYPSTTILAGGGWVVTWSVFDHIDPSNPQQGIYQQVYDSAGEPVGTETRVNPASQDYMLAATAVLPLADGGWVVAWQDSSSGDICQQRFDSSGTAMLAEEDVVVGEGESAPKLEAWGDGWTITWSKYEDTDDQTDVYRQTFGADGEAEGSVERVNSDAAGIQNLADVTTLANGNVVVSWLSNTIDGVHAAGIQCQIHDPDGDAVGDVITLMTPGRAEFGTVTALSGGGWVTTWLNTGVDTPAVHQQLFDASGTPQGDEIVLSGQVSGAERYPQVVSLESGGWVTVYADERFGMRGVYAQIYDANGAEVGDTKLFVTGNAVYNMAAVALKGGGWAVAWTKQNDAKMYVQALSDDGTALTSATAVTTTSVDIPLKPSLTALDDGGWIVTYTHNIHDGAFDDVHTRIYHLNNDAPTGADATIVVAEDTAHVFSAADFGFADGNGDLLTTVIITALPGSGTFTLDGVAVAVDDEIAVADLGDLNWTGDKDAFGTALASLSFRVQDDGGVAFDGEDRSEDAYTLTFDVTDVVDSFTGKKRADNLAGTGGADILDGKAGNDKLTGHDGADTFIFARGYDRDTVQDFEAGGEMQDLIDVSRLRNIDNLGDLKPLMEAHGNQVSIDFGNGDELVIRGVTIRELSKADFIF